MGIAMNPKRHKGRKGHRATIRILPFVSLVSFVAFVSALALPATSAAADRYAVIVSGASGGDNYALKYAGWRATFIDLLRGFNYPDDRIIVLADQEEGTTQKATRENVRAAL